MQYSGAGQQGPRKDTDSCPKKKHDMTTYSLIPQWFYLHSGRIMQKSLGLVVGINVAISGRMCGLFTWLYDAILIRRGLQ